MSAGGPVDHFLDWWTIQYSVCVTYLFSPMLNLGGLMTVKMHNGVLNGALSKETLQISSLPVDTMKAGDARKKPEV